MNTCVKFIRYPAVILVVLLVVYFFMRIPSLLDMPIFTDEAIYVRWAQIGSRDASWRFISLTDGKQPLYTWIAMAGMRVIHDPLVASRLVSVFAGSASLIGLYFLGRTVFVSHSAGLIASALYVFSPFSLLYDRMALYDSLVAAFFIWNTWLTVLFVTRNRLDAALLLGMGIGVGALNKTSAFFSLYLLPFSYILFDYWSPDKRKRFFQLLGFTLIVILLTIIIYSILRLSPFFYIIAQKDSLFVYPFREWIKHPIQFLWGNWRGLFDWLQFYITVPVFALVLWSLIEKGKFVREKLVLFLYFLIPFSALALFGRTLYPRYILFMVMPLYSLAGWGVVELVRYFGKRIGVILAILCFMPTVWMSVGILRDIKTAPIHPSDKGQYINDWPAGWGVNEVISYLNEQSKNGKIIIYTEGTFGLMPYALEIYLVDNKNVEIIGIWPFPPLIPKEIAQKTANNPVYLLMYQSQKEPNWPVNKILSYPQGANSEAQLRLYRILPQKIQ